LIKSGGVEGAARVERERKGMRARRAAGEMSMALKVVGCLLA